MVESFGQGEKPIDLIDRLEPEARLRELLAVHLRWLDGVDLEMFQQKWGTIPASTLKVLEKMEHLGLIEKGPKLTLKGVLLFDEIAIEMI